MSKQEKGVLIGILLAFIMVGAYTLYERLGEQIKSEQFAASESQEAVSEEEIIEEEVVEEAAEDVEAEKVKAPTFVVYDKENNEVNLEEFIGKPIVLNFWASWCGPCQMEMGDFNEKYLEAGEEVQFLMVNRTDGMRETVERATTYISESGYSFPILFDLESSAARAYGAYSIPATFFIDKDGYIIAQAHGPINAELLQKGIDMILE